MVELKILRDASVWVFLLRLIEKAVSIFLLSYLAGKLTPNQFGVYSSLILVLTLANVVTEGGLEDALIQRHESDITKHYNTLFSLRISRGVIVALLIILTSFIVVKILKIEGSENFIIAGAAVPLVSGLINPSFIEYKKSLDMKGYFYFIAPGIIAGAMVALLVTYFYSTEWALLSQLVVTQVVQLFYSYYISSFRPRFVINKNSLQIFSNFGKWTRLSYFGKYLSINFPIWVLGYIGGPAVLGVYYVGSRVSSSLTDEVNRSISLLVFPFYSKIKANKDSLRIFYFKLNRLICSISFPIYLFFIICSDRINSILFSKADWENLSDLTSILALNGLLQSIGTQNELLRAVNKVKIIWHLTIYRFLFILVSIYPFINKFSILGVGLSFLLGSSFLLIYGMYVTLGMLEISIKKYILNHLSIIISSVGFSLLLLILDINFNNQIFSIIFIFIISLIAYISLLFLVELFFGNSVLKDFKKIISQR